MRYNVVSVSSASQMKDFLTLPFIVYRYDPNWVAPITSEVRRILDQRRNPYFAQAKLKLFVCYRDETLASRVAIIINRLHQEKFGVRSAFFGFFESIEDLVAVRHLFDEAERYCRTRGVEFIEGPFSPSHYSEVGVQANKFGSEPTFFQPYNPEYYHWLLGEVGFRISARLHTRKNENMSEYVLSRYGTQKALRRIGDYTIRPLSKKNINEELERLREVNNDAFSSNWHFLPLSREEYLFSAKYLSLMTTQGLIQIVENRGKPVGVIHCVLDINPLLKKMRGKTGPLKTIRFIINRGKIRKLIIFSVGIKKAYQHTVVYKFLLSTFCQICLKYKEVETTWMSKENIPAVRASEHLGMKPDKEFVIYKKDLTGPLF